MNATNFQGSPEEMVQGFAQALQASGLAKTNANLEKMAIAAQGLFKTTDFQLAELSDFAKNASVFTAANMSSSEAMAAFTSLREVLKAEQSGTGLRNFVTTLQAGAITTESAANFERIGVNPEDVDFVGESLQDVLRTMKAATDKMPEGERNAALGKMFGKENVASARILLGSVGRIDELQKQQGDRQGFDAAAAVAASGMQAERNRVENERLASVVPIAPALAKRDAEMKRRANRQQSTVERIMIERGLGPAMAIGAGMETARNVEDITTGGSRPHSRRMQQMHDTILQTFLERVLGKSDEQIRLQQEQNELLRQQQGNRPQPQRPQVAPLPAATVP
jgi:hypothetical protein